MNSKNQCPACDGGGLVPALTCACTGANTAAPPAICPACMGSEVPRCIAAGRDQRIGYPVSSGPRSEQAKPDPPPRPAARPATPSISLTR